METASDGPLAQSGLVTGCPCTDHDSIQNFEESEMIGPEQDDIIISCLSRLFLGLKVEALRGIQIIKKKDESYL